MITPCLAEIYETWLIIRLTTNYPVERTAARLDLPEELVRRVIRTVSRYTARQVLRKARTDHYYRQVLGYRRVA